MLKQEEIVDRKSCFNKAEMNEPVFVLRANDEIAPGLVRKWAEMYARTKSRERDGMSPRQIAKYEEALQLANSMDQWRQERLMREQTQSDQHVEPIVVDGKRLITDDYGNSVSADRVNAKLPNGEML